MVVELKADKFKPEHLGQLGFYLAAVDAQVKAEHDGPTIGLLLCKSKNKVVAEYALRDSTRPMGVAEYQLIESLPATLKTSLPSIEQLELELGRTVMARMGERAQAIEVDIDGSSASGLKRQAAVASGAKKATTLAKAVQKRPKP